MKESLASEQQRTKSLDQSLALLSSSATTALADLSDLRLADGKLVKEMQRLSGSFKSLLTDVIRHNDVLELLLGEELLEFLEWSFQDQETHSIPALKEQLRLLQEQLRNNSLSISSLQSNKPGRSGRTAATKQTQVQFRYTFTLYHCVLITQFTNVY